MLSKSENDRFPHVVYEAEGYDEIVKPHIELIESMRGKFSDKLKNGYQREKITSGPDALSRIIRVFEFENRIFVSDKSRPVGYLNNIPASLMGKAYISIRSEMLSNLNGPQNTDNLMQLWNDLDSIVVDTDGKKITNVTLLWKDVSRNDTGYFYDYEEEFSHEDLPSALRLRLEEQT